MTRFAAALVAAGLVALPLSSPAAAVPPGGPLLRGVNLAGADFSPDKIPGRVDTDYVYPTEAEIAYFTARGATVFRLPVLWERLQPAATGPLDAGELARIRDTVKRVEGHGASLILDVHNYGRYRGEAIGSRSVPIAAFADLWSRLATAFRGDDDILFGLMNEPVALSPETLRDSANAAIAAIRRAGARNRVLVPGARWSGAHDFVEAGGRELSRIVDPAHAVIFEAHQYFDFNNSGTHWVCRGPRASVATLVGVTAWLRQHHARGFLGEFGVADNADCLASLDAVLAYLSANSDVWSGWTYWAAGAWWGTYPMSVEPDPAGDRPQMRILRKYLSRPNY